MRLMHLYSYSYFQIFLYKNKGGNGKEGAKGKDAPLKIHGALSRKNCSKKEYSCLKPNINTDNYYIKKDSNQNFYYFGQEGKSGGNGGDAGKAGRGGIAGFNGFSLLVNKSDSIALFYKHVTSIFGDDGKPGKPSLGGLYGDTAISCWFHNMPTNNHGLYSEWRDEYNRHESSTRRSFQRSSSTNLKLNYENQMRPKKPGINFNEIPAEYFKFLDDMNKKFVNSKLLEYEFSKIVKAMIAII